MASPGGNNHSVKNHRRKLIKNVKANAKKGAYLKSAQTWQ